MKGCTYPWPHWVKGKALHAGGFALELGEHGCFMGGLVRAHKLGLVDFRFAINDIQNMTNSRHFYVTKAFTTAHPQSAVNTMSIAICYAAQL